MPFTLAHPAAILVFRYVPGKLYSWSGLIIGSMAPDFAAILLLDAKKIYGHSVPGMFLLDLPLGLLLWLAFYFVIRDPLTANLPRALQRRLAGYRIANVPGYLKRRWPVIISSLLIGIASHLLWDSLTHSNEKLSFLNKRIGTGEWRMERYLWLQYISSFTGLVLLGFSMVTLPPRNVPGPGKPQWLFWPIVIIITILTVELIYRHAELENILINNLLCGVTLGLFMASLLIQYLSPNIKIKQ